MNVVLYPNFVGRGQNYQKVICKVQWYIFSGYNMKILEHKFLYLYLCYICQCRYLKIECFCVCRWLLLFHIVFYSKRLLIYNFILQWFLFGNVSNDVRLSCVGDVEITCAQCEKRTKISQNASFLPISFRIFCTGPLVGNVWFENVMTLQLLNSRAVKLKWTPGNKSHRSQITTYTDWQLFGNLKLQRPKRPRRRYL